MVRPLSLVLLAFASCASPGSEIHLAPFFSRHTVPGLDRAEAFGGILRAERRAEGVSDYAISPIWRQVTQPDGSSTTDFLFPFGKVIDDPDDERHLARFFPLFFHRSERRADGEIDTDWAFLLPLFWGGSSTDGEDYFAFFPLIGKLKNFLTFEEVRFFLFPLWMRTKARSGRTDHLLWPIFGRSTGANRGWRFWPFFSTLEREGRWKKRTAFWPLFHWGESGLDTENPRKGWLALFLGGHVEQGAFQSWTLFWPLLGWSSNQATGYRSYEIWPLVKIVRGGTGKGEPASLTRVWPLYSRYRSDEIEQTVLLWPFVWFRDDRHAGMERESFYLVPFLRAANTRREGVEGEESVHQFWPLWHRRVRPDGSVDSSFLSLDLALQSDAVSANLGFLYEVWATRQEGIDAPRRDRMLLDLYSRASAADHTRWSLPVLGGCWTEPDGRHHWSLLAGLLRFGHGGDRGFLLETPAFPGPGWPAIDGLEATP